MLQVRPLSPPSLNSLFVHSPSLSLSLGLPAAYAQNGLGGAGLPRALNAPSPRRSLARQLRRRQFVRSFVRLCNLAMDLHCYPARRTLPPLPSSSSFLPSFDLEFPWRAWRARVLKSALSDACTPASNLPFEERTDGFHQWIHSSSWHYFATF